VLARFTGTITQVPPAYSALKQDGERLYDLARRGKEVAPRPRSVTVHRLHLAAWSPPRLAIECEVSPGTYVRALGRDIGAALGTGGTLSSLTRTRCGRFRLQDSIELARLDPQTVREAMVPPADALPALPRLTVSREDARALSQGRAVLLRSGAGDAVTALAVTSDNSFLAVATAGNGLLRTRRVICNHD
jgi:tRNA pseudouridine55 synthase